MRPQTFLAIAATALAAVAGNPTSASDHLDGPATMGDRTIDITDMYAFQSPEHSERLVLILNSHPAATNTTWFSDALEYRFRLRPVSIAGTGASANFDVGDNEVVFSCMFTDLKKAGGRNQQSGRCHTPNGEVNLTVGQATTNKGYTKHGLRAFAGIRLDPFFMDVEGFMRSVEEKSLNFTHKNTAQDANTLSIILEIDAARFLPNSRGMYGVVSEIRTLGTKPIVLDTFGRPEVTNVILSDPGFDPVNQNIDLRDLFNRHDPFGEPGPYAEPFHARFNTNLHRIDMLDGSVDWPLNNGVHPLAALQQADYTVIDLSKPAVNGSWFEIERAVAEGRQHETGGGRWLNDDICDIQYSFLIARDRKKIGDGVDRATKPASKTFPYLRDPLISD